MKKNVSPKGSEAWTEIDRERRRGRQWDGGEMCLCVCVTSLWMFVFVSVHLCICISVYYPPVCFSVSAHALIC